MRKDHSVRSGLRSKSLLEKISPLVLSAGLLSGCSGTAVDQAVKAAGGKDAILSATSQVTVASGQRFDTSQTQRASDPAFQIPGDWNATTTYDISGERASVAWKRPSLFGGTFTYTEITDRDVGYFNGVDSVFTMMPQTTMLSGRVAAVRKHVRLFNPHLLLRKALEKPESVTIKDDADYKGAPHQVVELADGFAPVRLFIDKDSGVVAKVETVEDDPMLGDNTIEVAFDDYRDVSGIKIPHQATLSQAGVVLHKETRSSVTMNGAVEGSLFAIPAALPKTVDAADAARGEAISEYLHRYAAIGVNIDFDQSKYIKTDTLAQGVYLVNGTAAHTLAIELPTQVVVAEAPLDDARSRAVIAEIKRLIPSKPIKYIINTHHHADHAGGLRTYVAEGATVVTAQQNETYFKQVFAAPHKARPDALEQKPTAAKIQTVGATPYDITDGARRVRVMPLSTSHADGMLMVYIEDVQIVLVADIYSPGFFPSNMPIQGPFAAGAKELYMALSTSGLTIQSIAGVHGAGTSTFATLRTQAGF